MATRGLLLLLLLVVVTVRTEEIKNDTVSRQSRVFEEFTAPDSFIGYGGASQRQPMSSGDSVDPWASPLPEYLVKSMTAPREQRMSNAPPPREQLLTSEPDGRPVPTKNNYKLIVNCEDDDMKVRMEFERPFHGVVYSKGYFNKPECIFVQGDNRTSVFNFAIGYSTCGSANRKAQAPLPATATTSTTTTTTTTTSTTTTPAPTTTRAFAGFRSDQRPSWPATVAPAYSQNSSPLPDRVVSPDYAPYRPPASQSSQPQVTQQPVVNQPPQQQQQLPPQQFGYAPQQQLAYQQPFQPFAQGQQIPLNQLPTGFLGYNPSAQLYGGQSAYPVMQTSYPQGMQNSGQYLGMFGRTGRGLDDDAPSSTDMQWVEQTLVIQQDSNLQDAMDDAKSLQCEWRERYNKKVVMEGYKVEMADVVRASFPGDNVGAYMQIKSGLGPLSPDAKGVIKIGSPLTLVVGLTNSSSKFDLIVHSCYAKGVGTTPSIQLVDENGCVVRDKYLGPFIPYVDADAHFGHNRVVYAYFQAFKFPDSTEVDIECSVTVCRNSCPAQCFGRYKGEHGTFISNWTLSSTKRPIAPRPDKIRESGEFVKPFFSQGRIMEALEKRLNEVNGPQKFDVQVQSGSPFLLNSPRFLQPRELSPDDSNVTTTPSSTSHLQKVKRQVSQDSSDVGLRKKLTVIYPNETDGISDQFLLTSPLERLIRLSTTTQSAPVEHLARTVMIPIVAQTVPWKTTISDTITTTPVPAPTTSPSTTIFPKTSAPTIGHSFSTISTVEVSLVTNATTMPVIYTVPDLYSHVCLPLAGLIAVAVSVAVVVAAALLCGACMCWKYNREAKKCKQSFSPIYSEPRSVATPVSRRVLKTEI